MSIKINKNGKEYDLGFVPQSLYDDVEDLKEATDKLDAERMSTSILTYASNLESGFYVKQTASGTTDNPISSGSFIHFIYKYSTGITILTMPLGSRGLYMNGSTNGGSTWNGWSKVAE